MEIRRVFPSLFMVSCDVESETGLTYITESQLTIISCAKTTSIQTTCNTTANYGKQISKIHLSSSAMVPPKKVFTERGVQEAPTCSGSNSNSSQTVSTDSEFFL